MADQNDDLIAKESCTNLSLRNLFFSGRVHPADLFLYCCELFLSSKRVLSYLG